MINQYEVSGFLASHVPGIKVEGNLEEKSCLYKNVQSLVNFTCAKIKEHNYKAVKQCLLAADRLYNKGNAAVKNAIENMYVFSFSNMLHMESVERAHLLALIPLSLYTIYINQLQTHGC